MHGLTHFSVWFCSCFVFQRHEIAALFWLFATIKQFMRSVWTQCTSWMVRCTQHNSWNLWKTGRAESATFYPVTKTAFSVVFQINRKIRKMWQRFWDKSCLCHISLENASINKSCRISENDAHVHLTSSCMSRLRSFEDLCIRLGELHKPTAFLWNIYIEDTIRRKPYLSRELRQTVPVSMAQTLHGKRDSHQLVCCVCIHPNGPGEIGREVVIGTDMLRVQMVMPWVVPSRVSAARVAEEDIKTLYFFREQEEVICHVSHSSFSLYWSQRNCWKWISFLAESFRFGNWSRVLMSVSLSHLNISSICC